ncbi:hypothetical protein [Streptomyces sp. PvR034]|uniref:hypothetical protein n=1 Tax=Streptomyces sp. PvR034 TaxID=3156401 RepID=UPI003394C2BB
MARVEKAKVSTYDGEVWEYLTYAPGHTCCACTRTVQPLEPVRRGTIERASGSPVTVYRHNECPRAGAVT